MIAAIIPWIVAAAVILPGSSSSFRVMGPMLVGSPPVARAYSWSTADGQEVAAEWGTVEVPEDRRDPASRTLHLAYVRLPSTADRPGPPIVYLAGGPGASGIESGRGPRAALLLDLRRHADVVLLDQRGTGRSRPSVVCGKVWEHPPDEVVDAERESASMLAAARACRAQMMERGVALSGYNVREIADDVEALRQALGVEKISLLATSFGTRFALEVLRRNGASVDRAVLLGTVGPDHVLKSPVAVDSVLEHVDGGNGSSLAAVLRRVLGALEERPAAAAGFDVLTGRNVNLRITPFDLQRALFSRIDTAGSLQRLRETGLSLERGDFDALADDVLRFRKSWLGHLMPYLVTCSAIGTLERGRSMEEGAEKTLFGRTVNFGFPAICDALGVEPQDGSVQEPVLSNVPTLLVSGTLDARTPAGNAEAVLKGLSRGAHLKVEGAGHGDDLFVATPEIAEQVLAFLGGEEPTIERIAALPAWKRPPRPPRSEVKTVTESLHGVEVSDPYRWLEDSEAPETRIWVREQNGYADRLLHVLPGRLQLRREIEAFFAREAAERPRVRGDRAVYRRRSDWARLPRIFVRDGASEERLLLDPSTLDLGQGANVNVLDFSLDGRLVAYSLQQGGAEEVTVRFLDIEGGSLEDELPLGRYFGVAIAPDGRGAYYARELDSGEGSRYYYHRFGTDSSEDPVIFGQGYGRASVVWGNLSDDGRYLVLHGVSGTQRQIDVFVDRIIPDGSATGHDLTTRREVVSGIDATFYAGVLGDHVVIHTDWNAPKGRVLVAPVDRPGKETWREILPQRDDVVIAKVFGAGGRLLVETVEDLRSRLSVHDIEGRLLDVVPLPAVGTVHGLSGRWDDEIIYITFSSFHLPPSVHRYDLVEKELSVWHGRPGPGFDNEGFEVRRVWVPSRDGVKVPAFVIHGKGVTLDGSSPTLVTVYGGFGATSAPAFSPEAAVWIRRGGVYVVAHVRGGGELGRDWHLAAVRENKQRSIDDLLAVVDWLVERGYTRPERVALWGHSNGGMLVVAAMTQQPSRIRAVVSTHPLLDMLRYNKFLAARFWIVEYGSPDRADAFEFLRAYSPYHNVKPDEIYPAVFLMTSYGDTQVAPLHARKMAALLQAHGDSERPVVLRHYRSVGHGGAGVTTSHRVDELTEILSFVYWQLGET